MNPVAILERAMLHLNHYPDSDSMSDADDILRDCIKAIRRRK